MTAKLAPCPFCGGIPDLIRNEMVECCHVNQTINELPGMGTVVRTYGATQADAIAAWNRRATPEPSGDLVERAGKAAMSILDGSRSYERTKAIIAAFAVAEVAAAERAALERAAKINDAWLSSQELLLHVGELTVQELRTVKAVLTARSAAIRALDAPQTKENDHG